ncbi:MAG: DUF917 domain-containing protein [Chloroflexota bacterium]
MDLTCQDIADIACGAAFLGSGGGGDPYHGQVLVEQAIKDGCQVKLITLADLPDDSLVIPTALVGAPTVLIEKLPRGEELIRSLTQLEQHLGQTAFATMPAEGAGLNALMPLFVGARLGIPVVDADGMGRAFPELHMESFHIHGISSTPMVLSNEHGDSILITTHNNEMMEWLARGTTIRMGGVAYTAIFPMDGQTAKRTAIPRTLSTCLTLGRAIRKAEAKGNDPFQTLIKALGKTPYQFGQVIFSGRVVDVVRQTTDSFAQGMAYIESATGDGSLLKILFQNEYLLAQIKRDIKAIVPDLICVLDSRTAQPIGTEMIRYGQQVKVMAISAPPMLRTPEALAVLGPIAFGLEQNFQPVELTDKELAYA